MYAFAHIVHLFMAAVFVGIVFFEVIMLEGVRRRVSRAAMGEVERALGRRIRRIVPFIILLLYATGIVMAVNYGSLLATVLPGADQSSFGAQLLLKIILAVSVFLHFLLAMTLMLRGAMTARYSTVIHYSVFAHVVLIVLLAKTMFYVSW